MSRHRGWMVRRLPVGMRDDRVLVGLVSILEEVAETIQAQADQLPHIADTTVTAEGLLSWLGRFVDAPDTENLPVAERRDLIAEAGRQILRKGTRRYVGMLVAPYVDGPVEVVDDGGIFREGDGSRCEGRVLVRVGNLRHGTETDLRRLVRGIVPAHCVVSIEIAGRRIESEVAA